MITPDSEPILSLESDPISGGLPDTLAGEGELFTFGETEVLLEDPSLVSSPSSVEILEPELESIESAGAGDPLTGVKDDEPLALSANLEGDPLLSGGSLRIEAEDFTLNGYQVATGSFASGGEYIQLTQFSQTATATFTGDTGFYEIRVGYFDESDGESALVVSGNNNLGLLNGWYFTQNSGGSVPGSDTFVERAIAPSIELTTGTIFSFQGFRLSADESVAIDYIEFVPTTEPTPTNNQIYASFFNDLRLVDTGNGTSESVGTLLFNEVNALARQAETGRLYYVEGTNSPTPRLAYFDPDTGSNTLVGTLNTPNNQGFASRLAQVPLNASNSEYVGQFLLMDGGTRLYLVDPDTANTQLLGDLAGTNPTGPAFFGGGGDVAFDPTDPDRFYLTQKQEALDASLELYAGDLNTLTLEYIGDTGLSGFGGGGLAFNADGELLVSSDGAIFEIDPVTASATAIPAVATVGLLNDFAPTVSFVPEDTQPPTIAARVNNDTGLSNSDGISQQIDITGTASDGESDVGRLWANFEGFAPVDISDVLEPDGSFTISGNRLIELLGGTPPSDFDYSPYQGSYRFFLQAEDAFGNLSAVEEVPFTFDITPPMAIWGLEPNSDTPPVGDGETSISPVTLVGQTEPGSQVILTATGETVFADSEGRFEFDSVPLELGENSFTLSLTDLAGNQSTSSETFTRLEPSEMDEEAPVIAAGLTNDTGIENDGLTSDPGISGTVTDASAIAGFVAGLDDSTNLVDVLTYLEPDGSFSFDRPTLETLFGTISEGDRTLYLQAVDDKGNLSSAYEVTFTLDTTAPTLIFGLDPNTDTPPVGDNVTEFEEVTLAGTTEADATVTFDNRTTVADENGEFSFTNVMLALGENNLEMQVTDAAGNSQTVTQTIVRSQPDVPDTTPPVIAADLVSDTGSSDSDGVTSNPAVSGTIVDESAITNFVASFNGGSLVDVSDILNPDGTFALDRDRLETLFGGSLTDGTYSLQLQAADESGNLSELFALEFTLDTNAPTIALGLDPAFDTDPVGDGQTTLETVTIAGQTEANSTVTLVETGEIVTADENGNFSFANVSLNLGDNSFTVEVVDTAGNQNTLTESFTRTEVIEPDITLREKEGEDPQFNNFWEDNFIVPTDSAVLNLDITDIGFDFTDTDSINDALEIALVDGDGNALVRTIAPGRDAFFNLTENLQPDLGKGATFDGQTVRLDLSGIVPGTEATLQVRLVNNDGDKETYASFKPFEIEFATVENFTTTAPELTIASNNPIDFSALSDVSASLAANYEQTSFNRDTNVLFVDLGIENRGQYHVGGSLLVGVTNISDPSVRLREFDGITPEGIPYYNFTNLVEDGSLSPSEISESGTIQFVNSNEVQFTYDLVVWSQLNQAPEIVSEPDTEALTGRSYRYSVEAIDPDSDTLTYSLLVSPDGMSIDSETGEITWSPNSESAGNYSILVRVDDGRGGIAQQEFTLGAIAPPPNRPPLFTSTPIVDVNIGEDYTYQAMAIDPDGDSLIYSLVDPIAGMAIDGNTGQITWTPDADTFGLQEITVRVDDGNNGIAEQSFSILVGSEPGNNNPIFITDPVTQFNLATTGSGSGGGNPASGDVNPLQINLDIGSGEVTTETISITLPLEEVVGEADIVFAIDKSSSMGQELDWTGTIARQIESRLDELGIDARYGLVTFVSYNGSGSADPRNLQAGVRYSLFDPNNRLVGSGRSVPNEDSLRGLLLDETLPVTGNYTLVVSGVDEELFGDYGFTTLDLNETLSPQITSIPTPNSDLVFNTRIDGSIDTVLDRDVYAIEGTAGQQFFYDAIGNNGSIYLNIVDESGRIISHDLARNDRVPFTFEETGTYYLDFYVLSSSHTGNYSFALWDASDSSPLALSQPTTIQLPGTTESVLYQFEAQPGQQFSFDSLSSSAIGTWTVYDSQSQKVAEAELNEDLEAIALTSGTHTLAIANSSTSAINFEFQGNLLNNAPETISFGESISGNIAQLGERDVFVFSGQPGQQIVFDGLGDSSTSMNYDLVSPSGEKIVNRGGTHFDSSNLIILEEEGDYQIQVYDNSASRTGSYEFKVLDASINTLPFEETIDLTFASGKEAFVYSFEGEAGQSFVFDRLEPNSKSGRWRLYGPDGKQVTARALSVSSTQDTETVLSVDGNYVLAVFGEGITGFDYSFQVVSPETVVAPLDFNVPITGTIAKPGEKDAFSFEGTAGQQFAYDALLDHDRNLDVFLVSPSGDTLINGRSADDENLFTLKETGTYRLTVDGSGDTVADYSFQLLDSSTFESLSLNTVVDRPLSAYETAVYQFEVTGGQQLNFDNLLSGTGNWQLYISGYDRGTDEDNESLFFSSLGSDRQVTVDRDDIYTLVLRNTSSSTTSPRFQVLASTFDGDPPPLTSGTIVEDYVLGTPISNAIASGERKAYRFTATAGTQVYYDALEGFDSDSIFAALIAPDGRELFAEARGSSSYRHDERSDFSLLSLPIDGEYRLEFYGNSGAAGDYEFQLLASEDPLLFDTPIDIQLDPGYATQLYKFDGTAEQRLFFNSLSGSANLNWKLFDSYNLEVAGGGLGSNFEVNLPADDTYTLALIGNRSTPIDFSFQVVPSETSVVDLSLDTPVFGEISKAGERDIYTFTGEAGQTLYFDTLTPNANTMRVQVLAPSNTSIGDWPTNDESRLLTLTETGTYRVVAYGSGATTEAYGFQLLDVDSNPNLAVGDTANGTFASGLSAAVYSVSGQAGQQLGIVPSSDFAFGTDVQFDRVAANISTDPPGPFSEDEDGYAGLREALGYQFRPDASINAVLITDEVRSQIDNSFHFNNVLDALKHREIALESVVAVQFQEPTGENVLGVDSEGNAYVADGSGGYFIVPDGELIPGQSTSLNSAKTAYADLAWATDGVAWDIEKIEAGGHIAESFAAAFVDRQVAKLQTPFGLDVISTDNTIGFDNLTGTVNARPGESTTFEVQFTGTGEAHSFDLLFSQPGTNRVLGSIPVTVGANAIYFYPAMAVDPDGDTLSYRLSNAPDGSQIDPLTGEIEWTPTEAGVYSFTVEATDGRGGRAVQEYEVAVLVRNDNTDPVFTSEPRETAVEGIAYSYPVAATDDEGDRLQFFLDEAPEGASIDRNTGVVSWIPDTVSATPQPFSVRVTDGRGGSAVQAFGVTVGEDTGNIAPQFDSEPGTIAVAGERYRYDAIASDANDDVLRYELAVRPNGMSIDAETGTIVWEPKLSQVGEQTVIVRVEDGRGGIDLQAFSIATVADNRPALFSQPPLQATEGLPYEYRVRAIDADGDSLTYSIANAPAGMSIDESGVLRWETPILGAYDDIEIAVSDGSGESLQVFDLQVIPDTGNIAPEILSAPREAVRVGSNYLYRVEAVDANGDPLSYQLTNNPTGMTIDANTGFVFWQPQPGQLGSHAVTVEVSDGRGGIVEQDFTISVVSNATNSAPNIDSDPRAAATVDRLYRYDLTATDPEGDVLFWSLETGPAGMAIDEETGTLLWTPALEQIGSHEVIVEVTDGFGAIDTQTYTLDVRGVNVPPQITSVPLTLGSQGVEYNYVVTATDVEGDALAFSLNNAPTGMSIDSETGSCPGTSLWRAATN